MYRLRLAAGLLFAARSAAIPTKRATDGFNPSGTVPDNTIDDCTYWVNVENGDSCQSISANYGIDSATFYQYNPSIKGDCSGLQVGYSYCIEVNYGVGPPVTSTSSQPPKPTTTTSSAASTSTSASGPAPTQSGLTEDCTAFYKVKPGDGCYDIVQSYGTFTLDDFYSWNPAVHNDCSGLKSGYYVCVSVPGTPTASPSTTPSSTPSGPQPQQSGLTSDCTDFYKVKAGDGCYDIVQSYGGTFSLSDFYSWNPAVHDDCSGLQAGYYVCVGVKGTPSSPPTTTSKPTPTGPSPTQSGIVSDCVKYYQASSDDSCYTISQKYGTFSVDDFISWNPAVQQDCSKLFSGYYYCVARPNTPTTKPSTTSAQPTATGPSPTQSGIVDNCTKYYKSQSGDNCAVIAKKFGTFTVDDFISWNPAVQQDCSKLFLDYYYCVAVPGTPTTPINSPTPTPTQHGPQPQQPGITDRCDNYYKVGNGDNCYNIEQRFGISAAQFNRWNPSVGSDCQHLFAGYYVCVGV